MVLAFIITTLTGETPMVLYYQVYGQIVPCTDDISDCIPDSNTDDAAHCVRRTRKKHLIQIAETVHSEYQFRREANNLSPEEDIQRLSNDDTLPDFEEGHFLVSAKQVDSNKSHKDDGARSNTGQDVQHHSGGRPRSTVRSRLKEATSVVQHVTWMGAALTGFVLLCDTCENRTLAIQVLRLLVRFLQEHVRVLSQPSEVSARVDRVAEVLERVLPDGNLLFMNHRVVRHIEKELESAMKSLP